MFGALKFHPLVVSQIASKCDFYSIIITIHILPAKENDRNLVLKNDCIMLFICSMQQFCFATQLWHSTVKAEGLLQGHNMLTNGGSGYSGYSIMVALHFNMFEGHGQKSKRVRLAKVGRDRIPTVNCQSEQRKPISTSCEFVHAEEDG